MNYTRTEAGTAAVLNPKIEIPRPMKALLISMVGSFDTNLYASRFRGEQDVPAMLDALVKAGYIRALPGTDSPYVERVERVEAPVRSPAPQQPERLSVPANPVSARPLQDAVAAITDFVMSYMPDDALEISFALESLTTVAQLEASLRAYEIKIRPLGAIADQHLAVVKRMLGRA